MAQQLACDIVTPMQKVVSTEVHLVTVPGVEGEMGFLPNHAPIVSALADGEVRLVGEDESKIDRYLVHGGYVEVMTNKVIILADKACHLAEVDLEKVHEEADELRSEIEALPEGDARRATFEESLQWCELQIEYVKKSA